MYIDDLIAVFEQSVPNYSKLNTSEVLDSLRNSIEAKKYDLQDQGLIEAILREDKQDLVEDLVDTLEERTSKLEGDQLDKFLKPTKTTTAKNTDKSCLRCGKPGERYVYDETKSGKYQYGFFCLECSPYHF